MPVAVGSYWIKHKLQRMVLWKDQVGRAGDGGIEKAGAEVGAMADGLNFTSDPSKKNSLDPQS